MLDPSTYDTTHRYYEQKRAEVLDGVSSGDSGHPRGPRGRHSAPGTECSARAHWPHARTWRQPIKASFPYTSTRRPSKAIQGIKWDPRSSPRFTPWGKLNPGSKTSGGAESTVPTAGGPRKHTLRPEAPAPPAPHFGPRHALPREDRSAALKNGDAPPREDPQVPSVEVPPRSHKAHPRQPCREDAGRRDLAHRPRRATPFAGAPIKEDPGAKGRGACCRFSRV